MTQPVLRRFDAALNTARQVLYRYFAIGFVDPRTGCWDRLIDPELQACVSKSAELIRGEPLALPRELARGERPLDALDPTNLFTHPPHSEDALNAHYEGTFGLLVSASCPPYETLYINGKLTFQRSHQLADIAGFYRAFGLSVADNNPERPDHLVLELEFMAVLIGLERDAAEEWGPQHERVAICRAAQQRFLAEHLSWWTPTYAGLLVMCNAKGFYTELGSLLSAFLPAERALLDVAPAGTDVQPSRIETPDE